MAHEGDHDQHACDSWICSFRLCCQACAYECCRFEMSIMGFFKTFSSCVKAKSDFCFPCVLKLVWMSWIATPKFFYIFTLTFQQHESMKAPAKVRYVTHHFVNYCT